MSSSVHDTSAHAWLALSCARDGTIVQVLRDDLGIAREGLRLAEIVDSGSARKAEMLLASVGEHGCVVGWQLNVPFDEGARPLSFAAASLDGFVLVLAAPGSVPAPMDNHLYEELSRLNNELINRERELARKSAALERVAAEKGRMVAITAHDLRNPLTIVSAYADLLKIEGAVGGDHLLYVEEIARSARFMMELVEEMLDASRVENGYVDLDWQEIDLSRAADHAATINRIRAERKEIDITFEQEVDRVLIRADAVKLRQIINNLVVNAIKFSPSRTTVIIRVRRDADSALIEVEDRGIGIPREKLTTIFEPFRTLVPHGTAGEKSTGLGLAIVKQLAEMHGATVHVESEEGQGSLFRVAFPTVS